MDSVQKQAKKLVERYVRSGRADLTEQIEAVVKAARHQGQQEVYDLVLLRYQQWIAVTNRGRQTGKGNCHQALYGLEI